MSPAVREALRGSLRTNGWICLAMAGLSGWNAYRASQFQYVDTDNRLFGSLLVLTAVCFLAAVWLFARSVRL